MKNEKRRLLQKRVCPHRAFLYISGRLWISCHHPRIDSSNPRQFALFGGFLLALTCAFSRQSNMPRSAPKPCSAPGCGVLVHDGSGRCAKHPRATWGKQPTATKRVTGRRLQQMRQELFRRSPLCAECERLGRVTLATQRDHIKPLAEGGTDDDDNVQALCGPCHEGKSLQERLRGQRRSRL